MSDFPAAPTADESMQIAERFFAAAQQLADGDKDGALDAVCGWLTEAGDPMMASLRLWYLSSVGPVLVAAALQKLSGGPPADSGMWCIEQAGGGSEDPDALAAVRAVVAQANGDQAYSLDLISARYDAVEKDYGFDKAHESLLGVVANLLMMLAACQREGAFS